MELFRVALKVRPLPQHPLYWDVQFGHLLIWLHAKSPVDAADRARVIVNQLPYERVGTALAVHRDRLSLKPQFQICEQEAETVGLALYLIACSTGVDEDGFEESDPL